MSLATDAAPAYATLAPVTALLWKTLGYEPIVHLHAEGWLEPRSKFVRQKLVELGCRLVDVPTLEPLSVANTMRSVRLVAASHPDVGDDDFVLTADIDMFPLSRTFFDRKEDFVVLRCLGDIWVQPAAPIPPKPPSSAVGMRFPMCYSGAVGKVWRQLFSMTMGDATTSLRSTVGIHIQPYREGDGNNVDLDERVLSYYFSHRAALLGDQIEEVAVGVWRQGGLWLVDPIDAPKLTPHDHLHRGMIHEYWWGQGTKPEGAIDFITPRFYDQSGWWGFDVAKAYFPEHAEWISSYAAEARALA